MKAAGNYAADLNPVRFSHVLLTFLSRFALVLLNFSFCDDQVHAAQASGYNTTLYLDAREQRYVVRFPPLFL